MTDPRLFLAAFALRIGEQIAYEAIALYRHADVILETVNA